jgi:putative addiction module component (TIGR02574 family)
MKYTLTIDNPTEKIVALMNLIRSYDDIVLEEEAPAFELSNAQKSILDERVENHEKGTSKSYSWSEVKNRVRASK